MKNLLLLFFVSCTAALLAQDCTPWFPFKEGSIFEYSFFDKKDKKTGSMLYKVGDVKTSGSNVAYDLMATFFDKKGKEVVAFEFEAACNDGNYQVNMSNFMNPQYREIFNEMQVKTSGEDLVIPSKLAVGQTLPDAHSITEAEMGVINMKVEIEITDRKVVDKVKVETPLQTFDAFKINSSEKVKMPMFSRQSNSIYYYSPGYGQVKTESYDKKGKLDGYMLLTKFEP